MDEATTRRRAHLVVNIRDDATRSRKVPRWVKDWQELDSHQVAEGIEVVPIDFRHWVLG